MSLVLHIIRYSLGFLFAGTVGLVSAAGAAYWTLDRLDIYFKKHRIEGRSSDALGAYFLCMGFGGLFSAAVAGVSGFTAVVYLLTAE